MKLGIFKKLRMRPKREALSVSRPAEQDLAPRQGGQLRGKIWIAEDFDDPEVEGPFNGEGP